MIPILQKFCNGKPNLLPRPEYDFVHTFRFQGANEVLAAAVHHRAERRQALGKPTVTPMG